jgi:hypothetical protein
MLSTQQLCATVLAILPGSGVIMCVDKETSMSAEVLMCPVDDKPCDMVELCGLSHQALKGAIPKVVEQAGGDIAPQAAAGRLGEVIEALGATMRTDFDTQVDPNGDVRACPVGILEDPSTDAQGRRLTAHIVAASLGACITVTANEFRAAHEGGASNT